MNEKYLHHMKTRSFIWHGQLFYLLLFGILIQVLSAKIFGETVFWCEEVIICILVVLLYFNNKNYNKLVGVSHVDYIDLKEIKISYIPFFSRTISKTYFCFISYKYENRKNMYITTIEGENELKRFQNLLKEIKIPIAVSSDNKKYTLLMQEFFIEHGFYEGIESDCYPLALLVYIPRWIILLIAMYGKFVY